MSATGIKKGATGILSKGKGPSVILLICIPSMALGIEGALHKYQLQDYTDRCSLLTDTERKPYG